MAEVPVAFDLKFALVILSGGMTQGLKFVCLFVCLLVGLCVFLFEHITALALGPEWSM